MNRLVLASVAAAILAGSCGPSTPRFAFTHAEQRGRIEANGLRFVIMPDPSTDLVEVDVRWDVGSREDPPGKAGLAHLAEHLMFQQKLLGPDKPALMKIIGQYSTFFNAYTTWDTTHYMTTARKENFEQMMTVEYKRMELGCQTITEEEFLREREVVRNEIRQRGGGAADQIPQLVMDEVYPPGHAYREMIGGNDAQLVTITLKDACDWLNQYYVPENATIIVAGGVTLEDATKKLSWFQALPKKTPGPHRVIEPVQVKPGRKSYDLDIEKPIVTVTWALPDATTREGEAVQWGIGQAWGRVAQAAQEYDFATDVYPQVLGGQHAPILSMTLELKSASKVGEALDFVWKAADDAYRGFDEGTWQQLEEMKNRQKASFIESLEPLPERTRLMGDLVQFEREFDFDSQELFFFHELDQIDRFDGEFIGAQIKRYINADTARVVVFNANEQGLKGDRRARVKFQTKSHESVESPEVDPAEAKRPIKVEAELKALAGASRFTLGNGMEVVLLPATAMPIVNARLDFRVGSAIAPNSPALASAAADFLQLPMDAEAMGRTGISPGCGAGADTTTCYARGVSIYLDVIIKSLERLIKAGYYEQRQIERWQKNYRDRYSSRRAQVETETQRQFLAALYGETHPYTLTGIPSPEAVAKIGVDELRDFKDRHFTAANATLTLVGDFDPKRAESLVREHFGGWGRGNRDEDVSAAPLPRTGPIYVGVVDEKSGPQMGVSIGYPAPAGIDGQEAARNVLAEMMNYRMADIRFKLGATYGTYAGRPAQIGPTAYMMGGTVDAERAGEALKAMRDGLTILRTDANQFAIDFVRARRKQLTDLLGESTVTYELAQRLARLARFGLASDFYNKYLQLTASTGPAQVKALLESEVTPAGEVIVITGERAVLERAFAEAGITDIKLVEPALK